MKPKKKKHKLIPGIFNLCDRWCERCHLTAHCRLFSDQKKMEREFEEREKRQKAADQAALDMLNLKFWGELKQGFDKELAKLLEAAKSKPSGANPFGESDDEGFDLGNADDEEDSWKPRRIRQQTKINLDADAYSDAVNTFLETNFKEQMQSSPDSRTDLNDAEKEIDDAVNVITWYMFFITVKLMRACKVDVDESELEDADEMEKGFEIEDANISARLALLGITRSMQAWVRLRERVPENSSAIVDLLLRLNVLRQDVEEKFPDANKMKFVD